MRWVRGWVLLLLCTAVPAGAAGQERTRAPCPASGVIEIRSDGVVRTVPGSALRASIDTVYDLSIQQKRWTARDLSASVSAGVTGMERASWTACAGAWVTIQRADVLLENVQGQVRLRASLAPLVETLRRHSVGPESNPNRDDR
jgi:hypothetical protein